MKKFNIFYILIFIVFFSSLFSFIEIAQEKSTRKRLLKKEVYAISEFITNSCNKNLYNSKCIKTSLDQYLDNRKLIFSGIPTYLDGNSIELIENVKPYELGVDQNNFYRKDYELPFHKYHKIFGINIFLKDYTTTGLIFKDAEGNHTFIIGKMNQIEMAMPILKNSILYLGILLAILIIYILVYKNRIDCPFFYEKRIRITSKYLLYLFIVFNLFFISKKLVSPYEIQNVYPWIIEKMNPYKIHEFIFYIISILGFLFFYLFREKIKVKESYGRKLYNKLSNFRKILYKNE